METRRTKNRSSKHSGGRSGTSANRSNHSAINAGEKRTADARRENTSTKKKGSAQQTSARGASGSGGPAPAVKDKPSRVSSRNRGKAPERPLSPSSGGLGGAEAPALRKRKRPASADPVANRAGDRRASASVERSTRAEAAQKLCPEKKQKTVHTRSQAAKPGKGSASGASKGGASTSTATAKRSSQRGTPRTKRSGRAMESGRSGEKRRGDGGDNDPPDGGADGTSGGPGPGLAGRSLDDLDPEDFMELHGELRGSQMFSRNLASASSALQGLLKKLGAGIDDFMPSAYGSQFKTILANLKEEGSDAKQLEALNSLCDLLSIASEDSLVGFPVESFVPELVALLHKEHNPDLMLLAARSITHLADVLPSSCSAIVQYDAVPALCSRLLSIEYIDLAEQSLQALEKVAHEHPLACLRAGGLLAVLSYLDFFPTGVQRVAMSTAANIVRQIPDDLVDTVLESVGLLTNLLENHDTKVVEQACLCLTRITASIAKKYPKLEKFCSIGVVDSVAKLLSNSSAASSLNVSTFSSLFKLLATCCSGSSTVALQLLERDMSETLADLLRNSSLIASGPSSSGNSLRTAEHLVEVLLLVNELLPRLPDCEKATGEDEICLRISGLMAAGTRSGSYTAACKENQKKLAKALEEKPELLEKFNSSMLSLLLTVHGSAVNTQLRHTCLMALMKALYFSPPDMLLKNLKDMPISSFIAGILEGTDAGALDTALSMAVVLMEKLPHIFEKHFVKEGVVHAIRTLAASAGEGRPKEEAEEEREKSEGEAGTSRDQQQTARERLEELMRKADTLAGGTRSSASLRLDAASRAKKFLDTHRDALGGEDGSDCPTEGVRLLRDICSRFESDDKAAFNAVAEMFDVLALDGEAGISTFELISSGLIDSLKVFLTREGPNGGSGGGGGIARHEACMHRLKRFMSIAFKVSGNGSSPAVVHLIRRLQEVLTSIERFPVVLSQAPGSGFSGSLSVLSQPFKLRLRRLHTEQSLRDYGSNIVLIEPLATLAAVEDFLWTRVRRAPTAGGEGEGDDTADRKANPDDTGNDETKQVSNAVASDKGKAPVATTARATDAGNSAAEGSNKGKEAKPSRRAESDDEDDDDMDDDDDDDDDEDDMDDDDMDDEEIEDDEMAGVPVARSADVHDVRLGENSEPDSDTNRAGPSSGPAGRLANSRTEHSNQQGTLHGSLGGRAREGEPGRRRVSLGSEAEPRLKFSIRGRTLNSTSTILQAVQGGPSGASDDAQEHPRFGRRRLWDEIHTVYYSSADGPTTSSAAARVGDGSCTALSASRSLNVSSSLSASTLLDTRVPDALIESKKLESVLFLLRLLYGLSRGASEIMHGDNHERLMGELSTGNQIVPLEDFLNSKVASKVMRQLQDPITICSGSLPKWCDQISMYASFLLPFETRRHFVYCTAFGVPRSLMRLQQYQSANSGAGGDSESRDPRVGRIQRQKVRVQRSRILESAVKVMDLYSSSRAILEVEYFNEVGSGLGPTLEFYTLLSHELQRKSLELWRDFEISPSTADGEVSGTGLKGVRASNLLLFPKPLSPGHPKRTKILQYFRMMGSAAGKAILDSRLMDLPLSAAFLRLVRGNTLRDVDLIEVDPQLARTLHKFGEVAKRHADLVSKGKRGESAAVLVDGAEVEALGLDFTYPGMPDFKLKPLGDSIDVTLSTLGEYVESVKDATLRSGVQAQAQAFSEGFNKVIPLDVLAPFSDYEIDLLLCGTHESWTVEMLADSIKFDHGYTSASPPIRQFLNILSTLDFDQQRAFLRFVTGCPRLPPGGLGGLSPRLTVVRKQPSGVQTSSPGKPTNPATNPGTTAADADLPSVMTCANYLKLPPYSSEDIMRARILFAIKEGQCSFDLS